MRHNQKIFKDSYQEIVDLYKNGISIPKICKQFNVSFPTIRRVLKKFDVALRSAREEAQKYTVNENYFLNIDTEDKAYFLGLFYADGYVSSDFNFKGKRKSPGSGICICGDEEKELLIKFKEFSSFTGPVSEKKKLQLRFKQPYHIYIIDTVFRENLIKKGCIPLKSLILKFPSFEQIPKYLFNHFLRGFWDGDGSIHLNLEKPELNVTAITSLDFADGFVKFAESELGLKFGSYISKKSKIVYITGQINPVKFLSYIYQDATIYLKRKKDKFDKFIEIYTENSKNEDFLKNRNKRCLRQLSRLLNIDILNVCKTEISHEQQKNIIDAYNSGISIYKMSDILDLYPSKIIRFLKFKGYNTRRERLPKYTGEYAKKI